MNSREIIINGRVLKVERVFTDREVNFAISEHNEYLFRLVPAYDGFEISPLDKALGTMIPFSLVARLNDFIISADA